MTDPRIRGRAPIKMVEAYWEGLRNGRLMPNRGEVQARGLGAAMDNAFILERVANGFARMRVAGPRLNDLMGMETRGMPVSALFLPEQRSQLSDTLEAVFGEPAMARLTLLAPAAADGPMFAGEVLLLPLRSDLGDVTRALGCLIYEGMIGKAPRRFRIDAEERRTLTGFAETPEAPTIVPRRMVEAPGFAESTAAFEPPRQRRVGERPHLRLVKSDDE
jgi:hypothetical protein